MKIFNLAVKRNAAGEKHLDLQIHGVIDGGWSAEDQDSAHVADLIAKLSEHRDASTVHAHINSVGGSAFAGVALYNALEAHPGEVTCFVTGLAASAASLVAMAGKTVMCTGSMMMIHSPSSVAMGNAAEMRKTADVLDKVQSALAAIYTAKTGKSADEINALLDAETWMTAEDCVRDGFANAVAAAPEKEPDEGDPDEPGEGVEDRGENVLFNRVLFPRASMPAQILAMAKAPPPVPPVADLATQLAEAQALLAESAVEIATIRAEMAAHAATPAPTPLVNRAWLAERAPDVLSAILAEGTAAGTIAERARLQAIDELPAAGVEAIINEAKYGAAPSTAEAVCVAIVRAQAGAGAEMLAARRRDSAAVASVTPAVVDNSEHAERARKVAAMVAGMKAHNERT